MAKKIKLTDLKPDEKNFNKHNPYGMGLLEKSMRKFGFVEAGVISEDNVIASGNARQETAVNIGMEDVQIVDIDGTKPVYLRKKGLKSGTQEFHELALALNQVGQKNVVLDAELIECELGTAVCQEWGIELPENEVTEDNFDAEPPLKPITVLGDVYELDGKHRVLCGDSTDSDTVAKLMDGKKADMVFTDPPYGIDYSGGRTQVVAKKAYGKIKGDANKDISEFIKAILLVAGNKDYYICLSPINLKPALDLMPKVEGVIVWKKPSPGLGYQFIRRYCEFILFNTERAKAKNDSSEFDFWDIKTDERKDYNHGTQKPIALASRAIKFSSVKGDIVVDLFGGSGSTLIAAEQMERSCCLMEFDPAFVDLEVARYIKHKQSSGTEFTIKRNGVLLSPKDIQKYLAQIEKK